MCKFYLRKNAINYCIVLLYNFFVAGFGRSQFCSYETFRKLYYLRTHYYLHYFVNCAVTASCKYLMNMFITGETIV